MWHSFDNGSTIGQTGSEGVILRDEAHELGARITMERKGDRHYAITCGIYGWLFVCTHFLESDDEATWLLMRERLVAILDIIPYEDDPEVESKMDDVTDAITEFVEQFG